VTRLHAVRSGVQFLAGARDFALVHKVQSSSGAYPASYRWEPGSLPGTKREGREVGHSPPSSAEVKHEWSCTSTLPYAFMTWTGRTLPSDLLLNLRCRHHHHPPPSTPPTVALFSNVTCVQMPRTKRLPLRHRSPLNKRVKNVNKWRNLHQLVHGSFTSDVDINCYQLVHGSFTLAAGTVQRSVFLCAGNRTT
jgi:hypothetical protein